MTSHVNIRQTSIRQLPRDKIDMIFSIVILYGKVKQGDKRNFRSNLYPLHVLINSCLNTGLYIQQTLLVF